MVIISSGNERKLPRNPIDPNDLEYKRLSPACERGAFSCGYEYIDHFFKDLALAEHSALLCRVVTAHILNQSHPIGFYAMSAQSEPEYSFTSDASFFSRMKDRLFANRLHTIELKWVAVSNDFQRRGVGRELMNHALDDFYEVVDRTGVAALTLKPISNNAAIFYSKLGFTPYGNGDRMFLGADDVIATRLLNESPTSVQYPANWSGSR